jgi:phage shock protein A
LVQEKKELKKGNLDEEAETTTIATQTDGKTPNDLADELLTKRLNNLQDFTAYQTKLQAQEQIIVNYQERIKQLRAKPNLYRRQMLILTGLLAITLVALIMK